MEISYMIILAIVTYIFGAITKIYIDQVPNKFIPLQNVLIGVFSALICYFCGIETNLLQSFVLCLSATLSAGGVADLVKIAKKQPMGDE